MRLHLSALLACSKLCAVNAAHRHELKPRIQVNMPLAHESCPATRCTSLVCTKPLAKYKVSTAAWSSLNFAG